MKNKILVIYLSSGYVKSKALNIFLKFYKKYRPGIKHELIICFKNLHKLELKKRVKMLNNKCKYFVDPENKNDHEWGSVKRICEKYQNYYILFLNDHSFPICKNWLKIIASKIKFKRVIGCSASNSSHLSNSFYRHKNDNYFLAIFKLLRYFFFIPKFPNPHIRATGFLLHAKNYLQFIRGRSTQSKFKSLLLESGRDSFTNFFLKKKYDVIVINNKGKIFYKDEWKLSETFSYKDQSGSIIMDNKIKKYSTLSHKLKLKESYKCWG